MLTYCQCPYVLLGSKWFPPANMCCAEAGVTGAYVSEDGGEAKGSGAAAAAGPSTTLQLADDEAGELFDGEDDDDDEMLDDDDMDPEELEEMEKKMKGLGS